MKIIFFALAGLLMTPPSDFVDSFLKALGQSDRHTLAQTITIQKATAQIMPSKQEQPPFIPAPKNSIPVIVTVELIAKDPVKLSQHLKSPEVIPTTRLASGINYSWTVRDTINPNRFVLIQQWNSAEQQQGYISWREERGDLAQLRELLAQDPTVSYLAPTDTNTLPAQAE